MSTIIGLMLAFYWLGVLLAPESAVFSLLSDDAFYYFKIAKNIAEGNGPTFDGIESTNGFHPLWMLCMVAIYAIGWSDLYAPVLVVIIINGLLAALTLYGIFRLVERHIAPGFGAVGVAVAALPNLLTALTNGMETGLLLLATVGFLHFVYERGWHQLDAPPVAVFAYGAACGLLFLCRLDSIFVAIAAASLLVFGALAERRPLVPSAKRLAAFCSGFTLLAAPFFAWNLATFGHWMPISGAIKSTAPELRPSFDLNGDMFFGAVILLIDLTLVTVIVGIQVWRERALRPALESPLVVIAVACLAHFAHAFLFLSWGVYWWHFTLYGLLAALTLPVALMLISRAFPDSVRILRSAAVAILVIIAVGSKAIELNKKEMRHRVWWQAAAWADYNLDPDAIIALKDAGLFGYFSNRTVVNLDGKANSYAYQNQLAQSAVTEYLEGLGVDYIADLGCRDQNQECWIVIPRAGQVPVTMKMRREDLAYVSDPYPDRAFTLSATAKARFVIWNYKRQ